MAASSDDRTPLRVAEAAAEPRVPSSSEVTAASPRDADMGADMEAGADATADEGEVDSSGQGKGDKVEEEQGLQKKKDKKREAVPYRTLFRYADRTDYVLMVVGSVSAALDGATLPAFAILFGKLNDAIGLNQSDVNKLVDTVNHYALIMLFLAIGTWVVATLEIGLWTLVGERVTNKIREQYLRAVLRQDVGYFDTSMDSGELIAHITGDTILIGDAIGEKVGSFQHHMSTFFVGFIVGFYLSWQLTLVMLAVTPLLAGAGFVMNMAMTEYATQGQSAYADAGSLALEALGAIRTVKAFTLEEKLKSAYAKSMDKSLAASTRGGIAQGLGMGFVDFFFYSITALSLWYGSRLVQYNGYEPGSIIAAFFTVLLAGFGLGTALPNLAKFASGCAAAYSVYQTIDRRPVIDVDDQSGAELPTVKGDIEFRNVRFAYPSRPEAVIFQDFSLKVNAGESVALVGESGSGKSTVVSLLERYYDPLAGEVLVDGVDVRSLRLRWLRQHVGLVSQEPSLFAVTIRENIAYGRPGATLEDVIRAAKAANAHNFIKSLPDGYETHVGERGVQMSGGQKQRIAIARAVLKNPSILLLDEATSALDTESERIVQDALDRLMKGRTSIVIAHRLSTIINADRICVVKKGEVVEQGTHSELIANPDGQYTALVKFQQAAQEANRKELGDTDADVPLTAESGLGSRRLSADAGSLAAVSSKPSDMEAGADGLRKRRGWLSKLKGAMDDDDGEEKYVPAKSVPITRVFGYAKSEWWMLALGSAAAAGTGMIMPAFAIMFSYIIDTMYNLSSPEPGVAEDARSDANFWSLMLFVIACFALFTRSIQLSMLVAAGARLTRCVREMAFGSILRQEVAYFDEERNTSGALASRLENDAGLVKAALGDRLGLVVQNATTVVAGLVIAFVKGWRMALLITGVFPLILLGTYLNFAFFKGFSGEAKKLQEQANSVAAEAVGNIRTVAAFGLEEKTRERYSESLKKPLKIGTRKAQVAGIGFGYSQFVMYAAYALAFWFGGIMIQKGYMTFLEVLLTFFAIIFSAMSLSESSLLAPDVSKGKLAVDCTFEIIDREPAINAEDPRSKVLEKVRGDVALDGVHFVYPTRPSAVIFRNFNLQVEAGQSVALVGESGSGKSTVVSLIERFYDPLEGRVLIDGVDIKELQLQWLRRQVGLVSQEPVLFATSIWDNIVDGKPDASKEEVEAAAKAANAASFISRLPDGYNTFVGDRGVQLSGGQKQRIAIARAVLKNPSILLLDEATSALDTESEKVVQEALDRLMQGRTSIVIAHRLSTIRNCHKICVVQKGHIVEEGTHDELMAKDGAYASLARARRDTT